jgi:hypothetical protein
MASVTSTGQLEIEGRDDAHAGFPALPLRCNLRVLCPIDRRSACGYVEK